MAIIEDSFPFKRASRSVSSQRITRELYVKGHEPNLDEYEEEKEEEEEEEEVALPQPINVNARYAAESHDVAVSWSPYTHPDGKDVQYILSSQWTSNIKIVQISSLIIHQRAHSTFKWQFMSMAIRVQALH